MSPQSMSYWERVLINTRAVTVVFVLPCFNEETTVGHVIRETLKSNSDNRMIVAVNDGSTDATGRILRELQSKNRQSLVVLDHHQNRGLPQALRTGFLEALRLLKRSDGLIITMDADRTHSIEYVNELILAEENADVIIASRYVGEGTQINVPRHRIILSRAINFLMGRLFKLKINDITSNFRCYRASAIRELVNRYDGRFIESDGFEVASELIIKLHKIGCRIDEIPFKLDYSTKLGKSRINLTKTILSYTKLILRESLQHR